MLFQPRPQGNDFAPRPEPRPTPPQSLTCDGRTLLFSGPGRAAGSLVYLDLPRRQTTDLYTARVTTVGPLHTLAAVPGNPALAVVCIASAQLQGGAAAGDWLLVGPLAFDADGLARARNVWRLHVPAPAGARRPGVVCRVHATGRFGEIAGPANKKLFFHVADLPPGIVPGVNLLVGQPVSYVEELTDKGWNARQVRLG